MLLDLDGTLVDHEAAAESGLRAWLPTIGQPVTPETLARWHDLEEIHLAAWRAGTISFLEQRRRRLRDFLGTAAADEEVDATYAGYLTQYEAAWRAYDDVVPALQALQAAGIPTAVLTNGATVQQHKKLARTGLAALVGPVFTVEDLGVAKPLPEAFLGVCQRWGLAPADVLSVGDNYEFDVVAARAAGLNAVHLDRLGTGPVDEPHRIVTLGELPRLLS
ncbi:HAD-superfamily hydrolase [Actinoplanes sp. N902-109]|nr:HAD-superfamily hydrolase [Actinoplanes sp. N902-109]